MLNVSDADTVNISCRMQSSGFGVDLSRLGVGLGMEGLQISWVSGCMERKVSACPSQ